MYILFDIGGTSTRFASSLDGTSISDTKTESTPQSLNDAIVLYKKMVEELSNGAKIDAMAGGIAGPFNSEKNMLVNAPHLLGWVNKPLDQKFKEIAEVPVFFENDSSLAALGEATHGAGHGYKIVAYVGVGTGVGGARVVEGKIDANSIGFEPGNMIIEKNQTLETMISGSTIMQHYHKKASELNDPAYWHDFEEHLAAGLTNVTVMWSPDIIVLGGGVVLQTQLNLDKITLALYKSLTIYKKLPKVVRATLGDHSALEGSLVYLKSRLS